MFKYRTLKYIIWLLIALPSMAHALSLGEIKVHSHFAQPFSAEIDLPSYTSDELESLEVNLASADKFEALGLELLPYMEDFVFKLEEKPNGTPFIKIFSKKPLKELSISFVLEVSWLGGKLIKDFHTLLTPEAITELREEQLMQKQLAQINTVPAKNAAVRQTFAEEQIAPASTSAGTTVAEATAEEAPPVPTRQSERSSKIKKFGANGVEYTRVGSGESLSKIAMKIKDDPSTSLHQVMVALYEQNPDAFMNNNINNLKAGAKLTVNDIEDFKKLSKREAYALAHQYMNSSTARPETEAETDIASATDTETPTASREENKGNRLEIAGVTDEPVPLEIMEKLKQEQIASTEEELAFARKTADQLQLENAELRERIAAMEQGIELLSVQLLAAEDEKVADNAPFDGSATQQAENLIVTNADLAMNDKPEVSVMEMIAKYQTPLSISGVSLLSLALVLLRKKDNIKEALANIREKPAKKSSKKPEKNSTLA